MWPGSGGALVALLSVDIIPLPSSPSPIAPIKPSILRPNTRPHPQLGPQRSGYWRARERLQQGRGMSGPPQSSGTGQ